MLKIFAQKKKSYSKEDAKRIGDELKVDWNDIDIDEFTMGLNVELEHGTMYPDTNITDDDDIMTAKIALAHLKECKINKNGRSTYYTYLAKMERDCSESA